jgi:uncharacterized BrkB/YihY/UPF0761 family membrane protein
MRDAAASGSLGRRRAAPSRSASRPGAAADLKERMMSGPLKGKTDAESAQAGDETRTDIAAPARMPPVTDEVKSPGRRALRTRDEAARRVDELRKRSALVDAALEAGDIDRRRAGSLLAGGIAFRIFLWLLPAALFAAALVGLVRPAGRLSPDRVAESLGLAASVASTVEQATRQSDHGAAALLGIGIALMLWTSMSLVRALRVAHVLAWGEPFRRRARLPRDGAIFSAAIVATLAIETGITYLRHQDPALSLLLIPLSFAITGGFWLGLSMLLPRADANWRALVPGAVLFAIGHAVLQVATVYYFAPKLTRAPTLYGSLGSAATLLLWLFLVSRIVVASAFLNAALWRRSGGAS